MQQTAVQSSINWWQRLADPEYLENPYPELKQLQALGPIHYDPLSDIYFALGHEAFSKISRSKQMGRDTRVWTYAWNTEENRERDPLSYRFFKEFQPQMIMSNQPDHRRMRAVYEPVFRPRSVAAMADMIRSEAQELLDVLPAQGEIDFIDAFAGPLPLRVLRNLFEMPKAMDDQVSAWSAAIIKAGDIMMTAEQKAEAYAALMAFKTYLKDHLAKRRLKPGDGLIDTVIAAFDDGTMDEDETLTNLVAMLIAGHETTVTLIGNGMMILMQNPDQLTRLRQDASLIPSAVEEFMRVEPGGNMILRVAIEDFEVAGTVIPKGAMVIGLIGAVNRDPAVFANPDSVDVGRHPNPHLTFGAGVHFCVGAPLARLEGKIAFEMFLNHCADLTLAGKPAWRLDRMNARGLGKLPLAIRCR